MAVKDLTHGKSGDRVYRIYRNMMARCADATLPRYGGRGVKVCEHWLQSFENFYEDMGDPPTRCHSIERKNNNGDYCPSNCRWATRKEQNRNTSRNIFLEFGGERLVLKDWAIRLGLCEATLRGRLRRGWTVEEVLSVGKRSSKEVQVGRKSGNHFLTYDGKTLVIAEWARILGIGKSTIRQRILAGWTTEKALTTTVR